MAIKLPSRNDTMKVICKIDSAIVWPENEEDADDLWKRYLETNDESLLTFREGEQPTRFVLRKVLTFEQAGRVQNAQTAMKDGKLEIQLSFMLEEVRQALVDIENPEYVPLADRLTYKRDGDGAASKELIEGLHAVGAVMDLYSARASATAQFKESLKKK